MQMNVAIGLLLAGCLAGAGCAVEPVTSGSQALERSTSSAETFGVLALLRDPAVTEEVLDERVELDARAAHNLAWHRAGPDGMFPSHDDAPFDRIEDVQAVSWVGPVAMERLISFALLEGYVPGLDTEVGRPDGVSFTLAEAQHALWLANEASPDVLTGEVGLNSLTVSSTLASRPVRTLKELAQVYWMGPASLGRLRSHFRQQSDDHCTAHDDCVDTHRCTGIPRDGSADLGVCRPVATPPEAGPTCSLASPCGAATVCAGLTLGWGSGICVPSWMSGSYTNALERFIPRSDFMWASAVTVRGLATVPVDVTVQVDLEHTDPHSLILVLEDPNGSQAVLWDGPQQLQDAFPGDFVALGQITRDDEVNGRWLLRLVNHDGRGVGQLHSWTLSLTSRWD